MVRTFLLRALFHVVHGFGLNNIDHIVYFHRTFAKCAHLAGVVRRLFVAIAHFFSYILYKIRTFFHEIRRNGRKFNSKKGKKKPFTFLSMMAEHNFPRRRKQYFPRVNPLERFNREEKIRRRYRLSKEKVREIADFGTSNFATKGTRSGGGLSHEERVSLAIRFLASGSLYSLLSNSQGLDPSTVWRAVDAFVKYMFTVKGRYIKWPKPRQYAEAALKWSEIADFPWVLAAVDGTHIAMKCPSLLYFVTDIYVKSNGYSLVLVGTTKLTLE